MNQQENKNNSKVVHPQISTKEKSISPSIKVMGIGGAGVNTVSYMHKKGFKAVNFIYADTDHQSLEHKIQSQNSTVLKLKAGKEADGLGAGADPTVGEKAAIENQEAIKKLISGSHMLFLATGLGGGTGTGATPVVAKIAKEMGILVVAVVTKPFSFESGKRSQVAMEGKDKLLQHVDSILTIPNDKLMETLGGDATLLECFSKANDVLTNSIQGISELITKPGLINVDFSDVKSIMTKMGMAIMGTGIAKGENRAEEAAKKAISSPLLENISLEGTKGILVNITTGPDLKMNEFYRVGEIIKEIAREDANIIMGTSIDDNMKEDIRVTIIATGLSEEEEPKEEIFNPSDTVKTETIRQSSQPVRRPTIVDETVVPPVDNVASVESDKKDLGSSIKHFFGGKKDPNEPLEVKAGSEQEEMESVPTTAVPAFLRKMDD